MKDIKILKNFKKNGETEELNEEETEMEKVGFLAKHKKGIILGGLATLAAGAVALIWKASKYDPEDEFDENEDFYGDDSNEEVSEETTTEE